MIRWRAVGIAMAVLFTSVAAETAAETKPTSRVSASLGALYAEHIATAVGRAAPPSSRLARASGGRVVIDAVAEQDGAALATDLRALGLEDTSVFGRVVSGALPLDNIPALERVAGLRSARPSYATRRVGLITTQGDQALRADVARSAFGVSGAGVQVGVLSDSFNCLGGAGADATNGDLSPVTVIQELPNCSDGTDEGRAMLQIVHDVAPGASLSFATALGGSAAFANNILAMQRNGAKVIVDDIGYINEPMFQDGIVAQAVDAVVALGSVYFSAAGNDGRNSYESGFHAGATFDADAFPSAPGAARFFGGVAHNFTSGPNPQFQRITIPGGAELQLSLQWDSPFHSAGGIGTTNDVDVYLLNPDGTQVVAAAIEDNLMSGDAVEILDFVNSGPTADFNLMIVSFKGTLPGLIKYVHFGGVGIILDAPTASSTLFGHPNAVGAGGVGAAFFRDTPRFGVSPPVVDSYSSAGGTPILFDTAGNRLGAPAVRLKPDFIAADGVDTTFFGQQFPDGDNFPNFFGTSAAAPHAAAVAALMLQRDPSLTPAAVNAVLRQTAVDMAAPGFDFDTGFGLLQADVAVGGLSASPLVAAVLPSSRSVQVNRLASAFVTVINTGSTTAHGVTISPSTAVPGSFAFQMTDPATNVPVGSPNTPVDIPQNGSQTFVLSFVPNQVFGPADVSFNISGSGVPAVTPITGVNTLLLSASSTLVPDIVALAATPTPGLITNVSGPNGLGAFAVASVNVGASGSVTVTADTGGVPLPLTLSLCQTDPTSAACLSPPAPSVTTAIDAGATPTFSVFAVGNGNVAFAPSLNRIFVRFKDASGVTRGSTSTAVRTQ
jgi:hypothetical protein